MGVYHYKTNSMDEKHGYAPEEVEYIMSIDNMKSMVSKIESLQKPEWIEIYRIIKQTNQNQIQENNSGLWIVLNNLSEDTILRLHKFVEYSVSNNKELDQNKNEMNIMKMTIKANKDLVDNNSDKFIQNSELISGIDCNLVPQNSDCDFNKLDNLNGNNDGGNLFEALYNFNDANSNSQTSERKLTQSETDTLLKNILANRNM